MTYDPTDLACDTVPLRRNITNANDVISPVTSAGIDILTKKIIGRGTKRGDLYFVDDVSTGRVNLAQGAVDHKQRQIWLWHHRLGHPSFSYLQHMFPDLFIGCSVSDFKCDTCVLAKSHHVSYPLNSHNSAIPFGLVHSDVWRPSLITTSSGIRSFVTFIDDCTQMTWLYLLKHKSDVFMVFKTFHTMVQTQFSTRIRILRFDNGSEYVNNDFTHYLTNHGIFHETTCPQTPQQNGVVERKNSHLLETARSLLIGAYVPRSFWDVALQTATYLINRMPSKVLNFLIPLQVLATFVPLPSVLVLPLRVFGCVAFVHLHKNQRTKLDPCAIRCIFMGYEIHQKGYRCYHPSSRRMYTTMDVTFSEFEMYYSSASSNPPLQGKTLHDKQVWTMATTTDLSLPLAELVAESAMAMLPAQPTEAASLPTELVTGMTVPSSPMATVLPLADLETSTNTTPSSSQNIVPPDDHNPENIPELRSTMPINVSDVSNYQLPFRHNRGKPPNRYSPETTKGSKYPIANYVSSHKLSELGKTFVQQISNNSTPSSLKEALFEDRWTKAIEEEMDAL
ncbi:hypothetical protein ACFX11_039423 [Malus domestica]